MANILITGAGGNVGIEVIRFLHESNTDHQIVAGVRNPDKARKILAAYPNLKYVHFDFEDEKTFDQALEGIDRVFVLRPPHLSDVNKYFNPFFIKLKEMHINEVMFLSVQGAEKSKVIPHNKIERIILESGFHYIFLRPSYFMQNLSTTLINDIQTKREIVLPAGDAVFNWIDVENIGEVAAIMLKQFEDYKNQVYELTGLQNINFATVCKAINKAIIHPIAYSNVSPLHFYRIKRKEGMQKGMIVVMILLHFLPRFQQEPKISGVYEQVTGKKPTDLASFIEREKHQFEQQTIV